MSPEQQDTIILGLIWIVAFIGSSTCHEAAHAWVAKLGGDMTAYEAGQVTLDPWPHIRREPVGMLVAPILAYVLAGYMFGWASAPYNPVWANRHPKRAALMALAGPLANLVLALLGILAWQVLASDAFALSQSLTGVLRTAIYIVTMLNLLLFFFNLIPIAPLDGGQAVVLLFPERMARQVLAKTQAFGGFGILVAWCLMSGVLRRFDFHAFVLNLLNW